VVVKKKRHERKLLEFFFWQTRVCSRCTQTSADTNPSPAGSLLIALLSVRPGLTLREKKNWPEEKAVR
jgi:hypothetical protein